MMDFGLRRWAHPRKMQGNGQRIGTSYRHLSCQQGSIAAHSHTSAAGLDFNKLSITTMPRERQLMIDRLQSLWLRCSLR